MKLKFTSTIPAPLLLGGQLFLLYYRPCWPPHHQTYGIDHSESLFLFERLFASRGSTLLRGDLLCNYMELRILHCSNLRLQLLERLCWEMKNLLPNHDTGVWLCLPRHIQGHLEDVWQGSFISAHKDRDEVPRQTLLLPQC